MSLSTVNKWRSFTLITSIFTIDTFTGIQHSAKFCVDALLLPTRKYRRSRIVFRKNEHAGKIVTTFCEFKHKLPPSASFVVLKIIHKSSKSSKNESGGKKIKNLWD